MSVKELNQKLERAQLKLAPQPNQLNFFSFLARPTQAGQYTNYPGDSEEMEEMVETFLDIVEHKIAEADEALFILKNNWDEIDANKRPIATANKEKLEELLLNLRLLKNLYESFMVEPGVILIDDGEKEDPESFHLAIAPPTSIPADQAAHITTNWKDLLQQTESAVNLELTLNLDL